MDVSFRLVREGDDRTTVAVTGDVEYESAAGLVAAFEAALGHQRPSVARVDLAGCGFLDSVGLTALLRCRQLALAQGATFAVVNPSPLTNRVISVAGLADLMGLPER